MFLFEVSSLFLCAFTSPSEIPIMADITKNAGVDQTRNALFSFAIKVVLLQRNTS